MDKTLSQSNQSHYKQAFLLTFAAACILFLPFVLLDRGYFIYYGDFNVQQIPFYQLAHDAVRSGNWGWNWYTDLGVNFIGSYSFYLLFSPFFWLTLPFPNAAVPYLMAPLLILKTACAALTACLYLERFLRDRRWAVLGGLLYAFSGWMFFNIFFNHFHDVAVFFPLLLLSVEQLVCDGRKGFFALMVAVCAVVNYWFFVGEVVFVILYVFVRTTDRRWPMRPGTFCRLAFESILGVCLAMVVLLPSVLAILGNPRTGTDELLSGWEFWLYWHEQRQPAILQSLFFPPELPARPNFLPDHGAKWASLSGWLPLFGMTGVLAYCFGHSRDWLKRILVLSLVFAMIPGLNSLFILLNHSYYARWFFMPILLAALATVRALEDIPRRGTLYLRRGILWSGGIVLLFIAMSGLTPNFVEGELRFGMMENPQLFWAYAAIAVVSLVAVAFLTLYRWRSKHFQTLCTALTAVVSVAFGIAFLANGKITPQRSLAFINTNIRGGQAVTLPEEPFARIDTYEASDNLGMFWKRPSIQAFHSIVPPSIMEFYPEVGVKRDVASRPESEFFALRPLLSVRWLLIPYDNEEQSPMPGYTKYAQEAGFQIYENDHYIPMGFGYDQYISRSQLEEIEMRHRSNIMLRAVVLEDGDIPDLSHWLTGMDVAEFSRFSAGDMAVDAENRRAQSADSFAPDRSGFTAHSDLPEETLLFFSVPWDTGWSAWVNGEPADIYRVNIGFMAVLTPAGDADIHFVYRTPGLRLGGLISAGALLVLVAYLLLGRRRGSLPEPEPDLLAAEHLSWDAYREQYPDPAARKIWIQQILNEASHRFLPEELPPDQRTLYFEVPDDPPNE